MMNSYRTTDPEFMERFEHFAFDEAVNEPGQELEPVTRHMAILAALLGCSQGIDAFREELPDALNAGVTPVMVKEISSIRPWIIWESAGCCPSWKPQTRF